MINVADYVKTLPPTDRALAQTLNDALTTVQSITFDTATQFLELHAYDARVLCKWLTPDDTDACTTSNFEFIIPKDSMRHMVKSEGYTGLSLLADESGTAKYRVIEY